MRFFLLLLFALFTGVLGLPHLHAQLEVQPTFKVGLNLSTLDGPAEQANGEALERYERRTGFHVGAGATVSFSEVFGVRAELLYSQKGTDYFYNGPSYWIFFDDSGDPVYTTGGQRRMVVDQSLSYLDLPVMLFARVGPIEVSGGISAGVLIGAKGVGEVEYGDASLGIEPFTMDLELFYLSDKATTSGVGTQQINVPGGSFTLPQEVNAGYGTFGRTESPFNAIDIGLNVGLSFFINEGLYIGGRYNFGISDVSKAEQDYSRQALAADNSFVPQSDDEDKNRTLQFSVGFSF